VCDERCHPTRPGASEDDDDDCEEISDRAWGLMVACWLFNPNVRPDCHHVQRIMVSLVASSNRPKPQLVKMPEGIKTARKPNIDLRRAKQVLTGIHVSI
jgi:hypothetical protein